jgi:galactonate dehydratase
MSTSVSQSDSDSGSKPCSPVRTGHLSVRRAAKERAGERSRIPRRDLLKSCAALGVAGFAGAGIISRPARADGSAAPGITGLLNTAVKKVDRYWLNVPFRPLPGRHMLRSRANNWTHIEICKITLECGVVGIGENNQYFLENRGEDRKVVGRNAAELMWDDSLGNGFQQALFDAVGKVNEVPIHRLLGPKYRDKAFLSWWVIDMPGEDWAKECKEAVKQGYTSVKTKARPWFDLDEQCRILTQTLPDHFKVGVDFNRMLLDSARATRYCVRIEKYPHVANYETPIPQTDIEGNKAIRNATRVSIAMHYGRPPIMTALREGVCDEFVIGGGVTATMKDGTVAGVADKPFWLQHVGSGITAAFSLHFAAVLSHARRPAVNCHQLYVHPLIKPVIQVENGMASIPDAPGLGVDLDEEAVERFRGEQVTENPYPSPGQLIAIRWPSGASSYYTNAQQYYRAFEGGRLPVFPKGIYLESIPDDGSPEWKNLQLRARKGGLHVGGRPL